MQKRDLSKIDKLNCIVFPMVYGEGSKDNAIAEELFQMMVKYAQNKQECILKKDRDRKSVIDNLTKASPDSSEKSLSIIFRCEEGCAIKLTKDYDHSPINIQIISLEQWATGANDSKAKQLDLINPAGQTSVFMPTLTNRNEDLSAFSKKFKQKFQQSIVIIQRRQRNHDPNFSRLYSPQQIQQAVKLALRIDYRTDYDNEEKMKRENEIKEKNSAQTIVGHNIFLNKSQADTAWYVSRALALKLLGTSKQQKIISEQFIIGFRGYLLKQATAEKAKNRDYLREEVEKYKLCLDQIINQYKQKISKESKKIEKFLKLIETIQKNIIDIKSGKLTSSIEDKPNFYKKLNVELQQRPIFVKHQEKEHQKPKIEEKKISQFQIEVGKRFPFQQLVDLYRSVDKSNQSDLNRWILLTQKVIWGLTDQLCNNKRTIDMSVHIRQIQCEIGASTMGELVLIYEQQVKKKLEYYGMQLSGQTQSHIQLVRAITAVIAFQAVKINRERKKSNLFEYRVPFDIDELYNKFHSNSVDARRAMRQLKVYNSHRKTGKTPIFELNESSTTFHKFAREVGQETRSAHAWIQAMNKLTLTEQSLLANKAIILQLQSKMSTIQGYANYYQQVQNTWITNAINSSPSVTIQSPCKYYPAADPWLYAFLNNIPPDVLGMIKMLHLAQNAKDEKKLDDNNNLMFINPAFVGEKLPINISAKRLSGTQSISAQSPTAEIITTINPQQRALIYCGASLSSFGYTQVKFYNEIDNFFCLEQEQNKTIRQKIKFFLKPPSDSEMARQHEVYASLHQKPSDIELECYETMCNVRSAVNTQLSLLCSGILDRKIISDSYGQKPLFAERLILQTAGNISTYNKESQKYFGKAKKFLRQILKVWVYSDTRFCPVLAPMISFLSNEMIDDGLISEDEAKQIIKIPYQLSKKCLQEFKRAQQELFEKPGQKIQWEQRFTCMAAICCFRQVELVSQDTQQIVFFLEMIFRLRMSKILSDRQPKPEKKRNFQTQLEYSVEKAIYRNIGVMSNHINENHDELNRLVKALDNSLPDDVSWNRVNLFHFRGQSPTSEDIYQLNIYAGTIYKNGKQITCLDQVIKKNPYYVEIFGKDREFQVFPSHYPHYLRTKDNINYQFKINQKKGNIYFQFSEDGTVIRHIIKQPTIKCNEQIWTLIPRQKLRQAQCHIPSVYVQNHLAWYSDKRRCIAFRKPKFDEMYEIGMVVFLDSKEIKSTVLTASHITYHGSFENQNIDQICDPKNQAYDELILRKNNIKLDSITPFKVLSQFEDPKFIIQLKSRKNNEIFYLLHRYLLKFKIVDGSRLLSETYFGYALDYTYISTRNCLFNSFPCLVLEKYLNSPTIMNNHKRILLISDGAVKYGKIFKDDNPLEHIRSYKYDIHDFFGDIRGSTRESILHLAAIMLSINDNIKIGSIEMTPLQYSMYLIKSCFTNRPLTKFQGEKLENLISIGSTQIMLLSEALWKMSSFLSEILPFSGQNKDLPYRYWNYQKQFLQCRTLYENNYNGNTIRFREKINKDILKFLGVKLPETKKNQLKQQSNQSSSEEFSQHQSTYWKSIQDFSGEKIVRNLLQIKNQYDQFQLSTKKLNIWDQKFIKQDQIKFPQQIDSLRKKHKNDEMMKEMINELAQSFKVYYNEQSRIAQIATILTPQQKKKQLNQIKSLKKQARQILKLIEACISKIKEQNQTHPDVITGIRPTLTPAMYTSILCDADIIYQYFPALTRKAAELIKDVMKIWLELKTRTTSFERIEQLLQQVKVDVVAVMRQVLSPRQEVFKKNEWLCFEAEMKVQLWPSQLETYNNLINNSKSGSFCQLNMGEGKTQVIIPLIILNTIYSNSKNSGKPCLPRINLLSSLFEQARGNFFRFISATGFQIPAFQIPFNRKVKLVKNDINAIKHLIDSFSNKAYILMTRESRLSQILRYQEGKIICKVLEANPLSKFIYQQKDPSFRFDFKMSDTEKPLIKNDIFDVFDEIDALMNCKKSYIFSIGDQLDLASDMMRFQIIRLCLEVFLTQFFKQSLKKKIVVTDQTDEEAIEMIKKGEFPIGLRLTLQNQTSQEIFDFRRKLARKIVFESNRHEYSFIHLFKTEKNKEELLDYLIKPQMDNKYIPANIPDASKPQIFLLRGILAYGIFQHCLSMRCGVDFGAPNHLHIKRIAVPYEAADIPSRTSEYQQPDVSTLLSYISYYTKGLSEKFFEDCLQALLELSKTSKEIEYSQWIEILDDETRDKFEFQTAQKINFNSKAHRDLLFNTFKKNRRTIAFWLMKCIFLKDLKQFQKSICSSAWNLADVAKSVGFSGTKDNRWLYSNLLTWRPSQTPEILGTDGKMIHLITKFTNEVALIQENNKTLWQRFIDLALEKKVGCIIDAGAICVGKSLRDEIVPWIAEHEKFDSNRFLGISFCDNNGRWFVYDIEGKFYIPRGTTIPDHQTFVVFDQARTRGADLKMDGDIVAALSLGPELTKDSLMQAAGRLRKLGRNQSLIIMATHEVFSHLDQFPQNVKQHKQFIVQMNKKDKQRLPKQIIAWCCQNSIKDNHDLLMQFSQLGWKYIYSKVKKAPLEQPQTTDLEVMYSKPILFASVSQLGLKAQKSKEPELANHPTGKFICQMLSKYGKTVIKQAGSLDDVCEREVQAEKQKEKEQQDALTAMKAIPEETIPKKILTTLPEHPFVFDSKFKMTSNLIETTNSLSEKIKTQLPQLTFVKIKAGQVLAVSIREASRFIEENIIKKQKGDSYQIYMLNSLSLESQIIKNHELGLALISAKFLAGIENYDIKEENLLLDILIKSSKGKKEWSENYNTLVAQPLRLKRMYLKKFKGSTLEKLITRLHNEA